MTGLPTGLPTYPLRSTLSDHHNTTTILRLHGVFHACVSDIYLTSS